MIERIKRGVVHLECATDSEHFSERARRFQEQADLMQAGTISREEFIAAISGPTRDIRFHGTALFLSHDGQRYLLTARHVVWDEVTAGGDVAEEVRRAQDWPEAARPLLIADAVARAEHTIFGIVFRVPSLDEVLTRGPMGRPPRFLMNLGAGSPGSVPYLFSRPELDLALIALDQRDTKFADELEARGFKPVPSDVLADGPQSEGDEAFTVGFPGSTALLGQLDLDQATLNWSSSYLSLPVAAFGRVSMLHDALPFFWVDMSIYPGNSGGPLVIGDTVVGVVSAQATVANDDGEGETRIPFGRIIKAKYARELLDAQRQKELAFDAAMGRPRTKPSPDKSARNPLAPDA
jgi:hypothetical protein